VTTARALCAPLRSRPAIIGLPLRPEDHEPVSTVVDEVTTHLLRTQQDAVDAVALLDRAEGLVGSPLVDESERRRLGAAAADSADEHHHAVVARIDGSCVGYAGLVVPLADQHGVGDVAIGPGLDDVQPVLQALLQALDDVALSHSAHGTEVWKRRATTDDVATAIAAGYAVHRRLYVLGRSLEGLAGSEPTTRAMRADDIDEVAAVLRAAYAGTADAGWSRAVFEERTAYDWFALEDVRVAEVDGHVAGIHWTKRRDATTGEVYNLAVHPDAQGRRLGRLLLLDGLRHLADLGLRDVLLWVDLDNEAALRLYVGHGFRARWEDVALRRHTEPLRPHGHPERARG
jgi:mycothiol synthase